MAIVWVDPYLDSSNGGIHGTDPTCTNSNGTGSYAFPYSIQNISAAAADEVRFKGLPEDTFFPPANQQSWASGSNTVGNYLYAQSADAYKLVRVKESNGANQSIRYVPLRNTQCHIGYSSAWAYGIEPVNEAYGYYPFDTAYDLTISSGNHYIPNGTTVTAGWVNETTQGGKTYLRFPYSANVYLYFGTSANSAGSVTINAPELSIAVNYFYWYGHGTFDALTSGSMYNSSKQQYIRMIDGDVTLNQWDTCAYGTVYWYPSSGIFYAKKQSTGFYRYFYGNNNDMSLRFWRFQGSGGYYSYIYTQGSNNSVDITYEDNWSIWQYNGSYAWWTDFKNYSGVMITESIGVKDLSAATSSNSPTAIYGLPSATPSSATSPTLALTANDSAIFKATSMSNNYQSIYAATLNPSAPSLEQMTESALRVEVQAIYPTANKVGVSKDTAALKPCQLLACSKGQPPAYVYNSADFAGKMVWHFIPTASGALYYDIFPLQLPDYSANDISFDAVFNRTAGSTVWGRVRLYGTSATQHTMVHLGDVAMNFTADTATLQSTLTSATLTSNNITSIYAVVEGSPNAANIEVLAFDNMALTAV